MQSRNLISASIFAVILSACSSGGITLPPNQQCSADYLSTSPVSMKPAPAATMTMDAKINEEAQLMKPGKYTYSSSTIFFREKTGGAKALVIQMQDVANAQGVSTKQSGVCMRNARPITGILAEADGITDIVIDKSYQQTVSTRHFKFAITNSMNQYVVSPLSSTQQKFNSPDQAYPDAKKYIKVIMVKNSATDFEVRAQVFADAGVFDISTHMTFANCPNDKCP